MKQLVVAAAQMRMSLPQSLPEVEESLERFLRTAEAKRARLVVFPALSGLMALAPFLHGARTSLLKAADQARRGRASFWTRARGRLAGSLADMLKTDFGRLLEQALLHQGEALWGAYLDLFGRLAQRHTVTLVAGSAYLPDRNDGRVRHVSAVFGPDGELLGQQGAVTPAVDEAGFVQAGGRWQVIPTPAGRLGLLLGDDVLYPEAGRLLAYAGAEILVAQAACTYPVHYARLRQGLLARVEENQLYGAQSFLVGYNPFTPGEEAPFVGRSLIAAPIAMTPRYNGVLVEMGTDSTEGLITAEWSFEALQRHWETDPAPVRRRMPVAELGRFLGALYGRGLTLDEAARIGRLPEAPPALPEPASGGLLTGETSITAIEPPKEGGSEG